MAITLADFNKIWASTSPLTPYSFSESNYKQGWNFIGSTPPARQMWDFLQKQNDEKMQYLANNYLPLSGGTMSGTITFSANETYIGKSSDDGIIGFHGGSGSGRGASIFLYGKDWTNDNFGSFVVRASNGTNTYTLQGKHNGTLTWGSNNVITSAGGTFSGNVNFEKSNGGAIDFKNPSFDYSNPPTTITTFEGVNFLDKNGLTSGRLCASYIPNENAFYTRMQSRRSTTSIVEVIMSGTTSGDSCFFPGMDNVVTLGRSETRWKQLYAGTATINTSDERLKDNIEAIPDEVLDAWGEVGWFQYQFKDSIAEKGENARLHTGAIAQRIESVFESHNLDANRYGLLCYDEWEAVEEQKDEDGNIVQEAREAGNRYSLRYEEALCMEASYQRRRADRLEARIEALEKLLKK